VTASVMGEYVKKLLHFAVDIGVLYLGILGESGPQLLQSTVSQLFLTSLHMLFLVPV